MSGRGAAAGPNLAAEIAGHAAAALEAMLGQAVAVEETDAAISPDWVLTAVLSGSLEGSLVGAFDAAGAGWIAGAVLAMDEPPDPEAVADTLREIGAQACGLLSQSPLGAGSRASVQVERAPGAAPPPGRPDAFVLRAEDGSSVSSAWWSDVRPARGEQPYPAAAGPVPAPAPAPPATAGEAPNVEMILDIDLPLTVRFGMTEMALNELTRLGPGSVIDLGRSPDDPVDVMVNGKVVARGEVVVVSGNYGVRITEILSAADRIRSLAG